MYFFIRLLGLGGKSCVLDGLEAGAVEGSIDGSRCDMVMPKGFSAYFRTDFNDAWDSCVTREDMC
jgi:hypothetical protein